jgi:Tol biopolymer transport system component
MRMMAKNNYFRALVTVLAVTLAAAVLLVLFAPAEPAQAAFPGQNGKIVSGWSGLQTMDPDGSNRTDIGDGSEPDVSNYGKQVAYLAWNLDTDDYDIYTVPINGGEPTRITNTPEIDEYGPAWSPDGKRIAYYAHDGNYYQIYTVPVTGGEPTPVTDDGPDNRFPEWSPDGSKIVYAHKDVSDYEIAVSPSGGGRYKILTNNKTDDLHPDWSPDGQKIVYAHYDHEGVGFALEGISDDYDDADSYVVPANGGAPKALTDTKISVWEASYGCGGRFCSPFSESEEVPSYSPDGTKIVFSKHKYAAYNIGLGPNIYTMRASGGGYKNLGVTVYDPYLDWGMVPDNAGPETTITSGPARYFNSNTVFFYFISSESGSTFECTLDAPEFDAHVFLPCDSPQSYFNLIDGNTYTFFVRAIDPAGNVDTSPATHTWTVDLTKPTITELNPAPDSETTNRTPSIRATVTDAITELDKSRIKLYIDDLEIQNFSYDQATDKLTYKPSTNLSVDGHEVKVVATDVAKNQNTMTWNFRIVR